MLNRKSLSNIKYDSKDHFSIIKYIYDESFVEILLK